MKKSQPILICLLIFFLTTVRLTIFPQPWFDEGWMLSVAKNWVDLGHYGHLRQGEMISASILNAGFPATAPIALSFYLFDDGIWQGRLPSIFFLMGTMALLYHLARQLYGRRIATAALLFSLLLPSYPDLNPILYGRQALGEISALFYLLFGYALLFANWQKRGWQRLLAPLFFGLALQSKPQFLPFFVASLVGTLVLLLYQRRQPEMRLLLGTLLFSLGINAAFSWAFQLLLASSLFTQFSSGGAYGMISQLEVLQTYVVVLDPNFRLERLLDFEELFRISPFILGLGYGLYHHWGAFVKRPSSEAKTAWRLMLLLLAVTWFAWFYFLSIGFRRHLFPAYMVGTIFAAKLFYDVTFAFNFRLLFKRVAQQLSERSAKWRANVGITAVMLLIISATFSVLSILPIFLIEEDAYADVLAFLHEQTEPNALIETYESELYLQLDRTYHYPPDGVQHVLNRNLLFQNGEPVNYDPSGLDIACIVVGFTEGWLLYDEFIANEQYQLAYENAGYKVFCR